MKQIYQVEFHYENSERTWLPAIWAFTSMKEAAGYGEYRYRISNDIAYYRIRKADINPKFWKL